MVPVLITSANIYDSFTHTGFGYLLDLMSVYHDYPDFQMLSILLAKGKQMQTNSVWNLKEKG